MRARKPVQTTRPDLWKDLGDESRIVAKHNIVRATGGTQGANFVLDHPTGGVSVGGSIADLVAGLEDRRCDPIALMQFVAYGAIGPLFTPFRHIRRLAPGVEFTWSAGTGLGTTLRTTRPAAGWRNSPRAPQDWRAELSSIAERCVIVAWDKRSRAALEAELGAGRVSTISFDRKRESASRLASLIPRFRQSFAELAEEATYASGAPVSSLSALVICQAVRMMGFVPEALFTVLKTREARDFPQSIEVATNAIGRVSGRRRGGPLIRNEGTILLRTAARGSRLTVERVSTHLRIDAHNEQLESHLGLPVMLPNSVVAGAWGQLRPGFGGVRRFQSWEKLLATKVHGETGPMAHSALLEPESVLVSCLSPTQRLSLAKAIDRDPMVAQRIAAVGMWERVFNVHD